MKYLYCLLLVICFFNIANTQNLVPNPSFEEYTECPDGQCQIYKATGWFSASYSPDYFNSCENDGWGFSVPNSIYGYQYAANGNAYIVLRSFSLEWDGREYAGCQLIEQLEVGKKYFVNLNVSTVDNPQIYNSNCGINKLGVLFSKKSYMLSNLESCDGNSMTYLLPNNFAHVYTDSIITDTVNWVTISGSFIADSAYDYLYIGNFYDDAHTSYLKIDTSPNYCYALYYVDDIYVGKDSLTTIKAIESKYEIIVYPNPTNEYINVSIPESPNNKSILSIYNVFGKLIKTYNLTSIKQTLNIKEIEAGLYIVHIQTNNTILKTKFIKN